MDLATKSERLSLSDSEREILNIVRRQGSISRADITAHTNLTQQSVHRIVDGLTQNRLLAAEKAIVRGRGKPSPQIILDTSHAAALGVCIRTDTIEYTAIDLSGGVLDRGILEAPPNDLEAVLYELSEVISYLIGGGPLKARKILGIGVAVQGYRTNRQNSFTTPVLLDQWARLPIDEIFEDRLGYAAFAENNGTSGALAELYRGAGKNYRCFGYLSFDFGLGGGVIWDEKPVFGGHWNAGEISSMFRADEMQHRPALGELMKRLAGRGVKIVSIQQLQFEFDPQWPGVREWIEEVTPSLDLVVRAMTAVLDPNAIFFGGEAPSALRKLLIDACEPPVENSYGEIIPFPVLLPSEITGDAAALGAAMLPLRNIAFRNRAS